MICRHRGGLFAEFISLSMLRDNLFSTRPAADNRLLVVTFCQRSGPRPESLVTNPFRTPTRPGKYATGKLIMRYSRRPMRSEARTPEATRRSLRLRRNTANADDDGFSSRISLADRGDPEIRTHSSILEEEPNINRLVRPDLSARAELFAYASLGFATMAAVVIAVGATFNFATNLDRIANRLKPGPAVIVKTGAPGCEQNSRTNIAGTESPLGPSRRTGEPAATGSTIHRNADLPTG
jgi:hypothetical protein